MNRRLRSREQGISLLVVLVMLVVLTLFALSAINLSTSNLKVVGNMQARQSNDAVAFQAVETVMGSINYFSAPTSAVPFTSTGYTITVGNRSCLYAAAATGYSAVFTIAPEDTHWDFEVTVTDSTTGAKSVMHQGAKIRMLAGNCT
jgi:Tfp pilus assembly protein PilX